MEKKLTIINQPKKMSIKESYLGDSIKSGIIIAGFTVSSTAIHTYMNAISDKDTDSAPKESICDFLTKNYIECLNKCII